MSLVAHNYENIGRNVRDLYFHEITIFLFREISCIKNLENNNNTKEILKK